MFRTLPFSPPSSWLAGFHFLQFEVDLQIPLGPGAANSSLGLFQGCPCEVGLGGHVSSPSLSYHLLSMLYDQEGNNSAFGDEPETARFTRWILHGKCCI